MRAIITLLWVAFLFICTCTKNLNRFMEEQKVSFAFTQNPTISELWITSDIHLDSQYYLFVKLGHFTAFGVLYILLFLVTKKKNFSLVFAVLFAFLTEILQLYFGRDGRIVDVLIDSLGIVLAYLMTANTVALFKKLPSQ